MIPLATTTITVWRADPTLLGVDQVDPWELAETAPTEPGTMIATLVRAVMGKQSQATTFDGGTHEVTKVGCRCDTIPGIRLWDSVVDDLTGERWRIVSVIQRPAPPGGSLGHTSMELMRTTGAV